MAPLPRCTTHPPTPLPLYPTIPHPFPSLLPPSVDLSIHLFLAVGSLPQNISVLSQ